MCLHLQSTVCVYGLGISVGVTVSPLHYRIHVNSSVLSAVVCEVAITVCGHITTLKNNVKKKIKYQSQSILIFTLLLTNEKQKLD